MTLKTLRQKDLSKDIISLLKTHARFFFADGFRFYTPRILEIDLKPLSKPDRKKLELLADKLIREGSNNILIECEDSIKKHGNILRR